MIDALPAATADELYNGFAYDGKDESYVCLFCGERYTDGFVYDCGGRLAGARRAAQSHVSREHGSAFEALLSGGKKLTGLTDNQSDLLMRLYRGESDEEIAAATHTSPSTVRFQRHSFRERAKQARVILALSALFEERVGRGAARESVIIHEGAKMVDERYMTTEAEAERIAGNFFTSRDPLILKVFPAKEKNKLVILRMIALKFGRGKRYCEREINDTLEAIYDDYATLRRYLIEYGFMDRTQDCAEYWLREREAYNEADAL